jgi:4-hydroxybenzoate polyprenyltransferase
MKVPHRRQLNDILWGLFLLSHPGPVLFHIIAVAVFALLAAWPHVAWGIFALIVGAHAAMQISIAMLNDYCDRRMDARGKPHKPIPRGLILPREALVAGLLMIAFMLILLLPLPPLALIFSLAYLALGQGYNLGLKSTPLSGIVFALAMPLIPLYAFAGVGRSLPFLFWLAPVGFLLGVALNLANSLPDVEEDAAGGARTLAVALGVKRSFLLCQLSILLSAVLIAGLALLNIVPAQPLALIITLILTALSIVAMQLFSGPTKPVETRKGFFYLFVLTCIVLTGGWLIGAFI